MSEQKICPMCFLDHDLPECRVVTVFQVVSAHGLYSHTGSRNSANGMVKRGGLYRLRTWETSRGIIPSTEPVCNIKFLKQMHELDPAVYFGTNWKDAYISGGRNIYGFKWFMMRYKHLIEDGTASILKEAYRLSAQADGRTWEDEYYGLNTRPYIEGFE